jgi:hypothetical protein
MTMLIFGTVSGVEVNKKRNLDRALKREKTNKFLIFFYGF